MTFNYARRHPSTPLNDGKHRNWNNILESNYRNLLEFPGQNGKMMEFIRKVATMEVHSRARGGRNMKKEE
jgi:hypothetical protein